jgi:hypothetical protein
MEEVLPPSTESGAGFEPVTVRQFTIFLESRVGRLTMLLRALEEQVRVVGMAIEESADAALCRVICADNNTGRYLLGENGFTFSESEVLLVALPKGTDQPLLSICTALLGAEINIHYTYPLLICPNNDPALVIYCDDIILASQLLMRKGYRLLGQSDLADTPPDPDAPHPENN